MDSTYQDDINRLLKQGEYLIAYDLASTLIKQHPDDKSIQYLSVLALARSGATKRALALYNDYQLNTIDNEDYAALEARLYKDAAYQCLTSDRDALLIKAAECYEDAFKKTKGYYSAVNAATLYFLAKKKQKARLLATEAYQLCVNSPPGEGLGEYYRLATIAETCLVLNETDEAHQALIDAAPHAQGDYSALATTRRQLSLLIDDDAVKQLLQPITAPSVIHYSGHMISPVQGKGRFRPENEALVKDAIYQQIINSNIGFGYGSLASGADIIFAEALLEANANLYVVLPFDIDEFVDISVKPSGEQWVSRFEHCIKHATLVTSATEDSYLGDISLFHYASRLAMGMAIQKSRHLQTAIRQIAVWDGEITEGVAGTAADIRLWQSQQHAATLICSKTGQLLPTVKQFPPIAADSEQMHSGRQTNAMIFGDIKGFSKLSDKQIPAFVNTILGEIGETLKNYGDKVLMRNTWGDGIFIVFRDALTAATCAIALQETMASIDLEKAGLPNHIALRLSVHFGPVYQMQDPILKHTNYFGSHVSKAARIEPVTPEGEVYTTRQFVAELALLENTDYSTEYVGVMPAAKKYGEMPMYLLKKTHAVNP